MRGTLENAWTLREREVKKRAPGGALKFAVNFEPIGVLSFVFFVLLEVMFPEVSDLSNP